MPDKKPSGKEDEQDKKTKPEDETPEDEVEDEEDEEAEGEDLSKLKSALKKERLERKKAARELKQLQKKHEDATKSKQEQEQSELDKAKGEAARLKDENDKLQAQMRTERIKSAVITRATELGFIKPSQAYKLVDLDEIDEEDGEVTGVDEALDELAKDNKHLLKSDDAGDKDAPDIGAGKGGKAKKTTKAELEKQYEAQLRATGQY